MMQLIPARRARAMFFASVLPPGTTTAAAPARATSFPTFGIFASWSESTRSARKSAARIRAGSCVSTASGLSIPSTAEKTRFTSS